MNKTALLKIISVAVPYLAVGFGLYTISNGWITFACYHLGLIFFIAITGKFHFFSKLLRGWNNRAALLSVIACSFIGPILLLIWPFISLEPDNLKVQLSQVGLDGMGWYIFTFIFVAINPVMEEVYWRGLLDGNGKLPWITDLIFAGYHLPVLAFFIKPLWLILAFIAVSFAGWFWRWLARKYDGLALPLVSHIAADLFIVIAVQSIAN